MQAESIFPTNTIQCFPNQKPWVDKTVQDEVNMLTTAYIVRQWMGHYSEYKATFCSLREVMKEAKRWYKEKVESNLHLGL